MSGWNMDGELHGVLHPYISVRDKETDGWILWRWDNPSLRFDMGIHNWTKENRKRWEEVEYPKVQQDLVKSVRKGSIKPPKMGRNEKCFCGSGVKYKNCCLTNNQVGVS